MRNEPRDGTVVSAGKIKGCPLAPMSVYPYRAKSTSSKFQSSSHSSDVPAEDPDHATSPITRCGEALAIVAYMGEIVSKEMSVARQTSRHECMRRNIE
jgi:hypothetical protein